MADLEGAFPRLRTAPYRVTSPETPQYNCIAWAAGDTERWWWPDALDLAYWPAGIPREESVAAFVQAYERLGFEVCEDESPEPECEKIAIFAIADRPKHVARQLADGTWTSKLGSGVDIEHILESLECELYGAVVSVMRRALRRQG